MSVQLSTWKAQTVRNWVSHPEPDAGEKWLLSELGPSHQLEMYLQM